MVPNLFVEIPLSRSFKKAYLFFIKIFSNCHFSVAIGLTSSINALIWKFFICRKNSEQKCFLLFQNVLKSFLVVPRTPKTSALFAIFVEFKTHDHLKLFFDITLFEQMCSIFIITYTKTKVLSWTIKQRNKLKNSSGEASIENHFLVLCSFFICTNPLKAKTAV